MNKLAAITAFLGGQKNRYMQYEPNRSLEEKMAVAAGIEKLTDWSFATRRILQTFPCSSVFLEITGQQVGTVQHKAERSKPRRRGMGGRR